MAAVPLVLLSLVQPDPVDERLPTLRFLADEQRQDSSNPLLKRLQRSLLLLIRLAVIVLFALEHNDSQFSTLRRSLDRLDTGEDLFGSFESVWVG